MSVFTRLLLLFFISLLFGGAALAAERSYIKATELEARIKLEQPTNIVDIQVENEFNSHHIKGATATYAYPVKSASDKAKIEALVGQLNANTDPIVVVCPRGAGGANRAYDYLLSRGFPAERLSILEKGQAGWTNAKLTERN